MSFVESHEQYKHNLLESYSLPDKNGVVKLNLKDDSSREYTEFNAYMYDSVKREMMESLYAFAMKLFNRCNSYGFCNDSNESEYEDNEKIEMLPALKYKWMSIRRFGIYEKETKGISIIGTNEIIINGGSDIEMLKLEYSRYYNGYSVVFTGTLQDLIDIINQFTDSPNEFSLILPEDEVEYVGEISGLVRVLKNFNSKYN